MPGLRECLLTSLLSNDLSSCLKHLRRKSDSAPQSYRGLWKKRSLLASREALGYVEHFAIQAFRNVDTLDNSLASIEEFNPMRVDDMRRQFEIPSPAIEHVSPYPFSGTAA